MRDKTSQLCHHCDLFNCVSTTLCLCKVIIFSDCVWLRNPRTCLCNLKSFCFYPKLNVSMVIIFNESQTDLSSCFCLWNRSTLKESHLNGFLYDFRNKSMSHNHWAHNSRSGSKLRGKYDAPFTSIDSSRKCGGCEAQTGFPLPLKLMLNICNLVSDRAGSVMP